MGVNERDQMNTAAANLTEARVNLKPAAGQQIEVFSVYVPTRPLGNTYAVRQIAAASPSRALRIAAKQAGDYRGIRVRNAAGVRIY